MTTATNMPLRFGPEAYVPWRLVCQECERWEPIEPMRKVDKDAMNRILLIGPTTGVETTCQRFASGVHGVLKRCGGQLLVEP